MTRPLSIAVTPSPPRFPIANWRLANGLRVVVQPDRRWPLIASTVCYDAGSRTDPAGRSGLTHLCEHLAFYGPRRTGVRTYAERIESTGGSAQAATTSDRVCFSAVCSPAALETVLTVEAERMTSPWQAEDAGALEIQRRILLNELRQRSQVRTRATAIEHLHRALFQEAHPYHRPPAGDADGIRAVTSEDVRAFASRIAPCNAVLVLTGDLSEDDAEILVQRIFANVPTGVERARDTSVQRLVPPDAPALRLPSAVSGTHAYVAWVIPGFGQEEWYRAALLVRGLAAGRSSPLTRELVERGLAQEVHAHVVTMRDASTVMFVAVAARGIDSLRLERGLSDALDRLLSAGPSAGALERARRKALSDHYVAVQNLERRADLCASMSCYLDAPERLNEESARYLDQDANAIAALAATLRRQPPHATLSLVPLTEAA